MDVSGSGPRRRGRIANLVESGRLEVVLAACLAGLAIVLELGTGQSWQGLVLDLIACAAAAGTARWPRVAGIALGMVLALYVVIPSDWATLGEYALLIPILGSGMRGATRMRTAFTLGYFPLLAARTLVLAPDTVSGVLGWLVWGVLIASLWLIGNAFVAVTEAHRQARAAALVLQRQELSRELHDTVARSLTKVALAAERARLRGSATDADLALISETATESIQELRWVMSLLRGPVEPGILMAMRRTPLDEALATAERELSRQGFTLALSLEGDPQRLPPETAGALGAATGEAVANIIKHGDPSSPCAIVVDITDQDADLLFINTPKEARSSPGPGEGTGLDALTQRLAAIGGRVSTEHSASQFRTRVRLPLNVPDRPPRRAA